MTAASRRVGMQATTQGVPRAAVNSPGRLLDRRRHAQSLGITDDFAGFAVTDVQK
jgi:hypothetical protein